MKNYLTLIVCLIISLPIISQTDTGTEELVCIPKVQAVEIVKELTKYDLCNVERDSLMGYVTDLETIVREDSVLIDYYQNVTDSLVLINKEYTNKTTALNLELISKDEKINNLRNTRNLTILTTILTAVIPTILNKNE